MGQFLGKKCVCFSISNFLNLFIYLYISNLFLCYLKSCLIGSQLKNLLDIQGFGVFLSKSHCSGINMGSCILRFWEGTGWINS